MKLYSEEQVKQLLAEQRHYCQVEHNKRSLHDEQGFYVHCEDVLNAEYPELPSESYSPRFEWIAVKDDLPEEEKSVLCICNHQHLLFSSRKWQSIAIGQRLSGNEFYTDNGDPTVVSVSHWSPLLELPKTAES